MPKKAITFGPKCYQKLKPKKQHHTNPNSAQKRPKKLEEYCFLKLKEKLVEPLLPNTKSPFS